MKQEAGQKFTTDDTPPLYRAILEYQKKNPARFHTPGHGGVAIYGDKKEFSTLDKVFGEIFPFDVTEIPGLDSLYEAQGPIAASEALYQALYGSEKTLFSAGGSTLCIQTMLALVSRPGGTVAVNRGAHTSVIHGLTLLGMDPVWIWPSQDRTTGLFSPVTSAQVKNTLEQYPQVEAVFITSPDYYGQNCDIAAIADLCQSAGVPLLVDAAHGAHYPFVKGVEHPNRLGATMCCNSLHKTTPALTGAALLHINDCSYLAQAKQRMSLFGSTSPSYLIMLSMDLLLPVLANHGKACWQELILRVESLKQLAKSQGLQVLSGNIDPARLTVGYGAAGYTAEEFLQQAEACGVEPEYVDPRYGVFLPAITMGEKDWGALKRLIQALPKKNRVSPPEIAFPPPTVRCSLPQAMFSNTRKVALEQSVGKVAGAVVSPCPPGIPLLVPGEEITPQVQKVLAYYGISQVSVIQ